MVKVVTFWYIIVVFKLLFSVDKNLFRKSKKKTSKKQIRVQQHLNLMLMCLNENLLPIYTNIYIYICIYVYFCVYCVNENIYIFIEKIQKSSYREDYKVHFRNLFVHAGDYSRPREQRPIFFVHNDPEVFLIGVSLKCHL